MAQAIGKISEANEQIAKSLTGIQDNLKVLNDNNILHAANTANNEKTILDEIKLMRTKYWWALVALFCVVLLVLGYKEIIPTLARVPLP